MLLRTDNHYIVNKTDYSRPQSHPTSSGTACSEVEALYAIKENVLTNKNYKHVN